MSTYTAIKSRIERILIDASHADVTAEMDGWIAKAQLRLEDAYDWRALRAQHTITTATGDRDYTMPTDWARPRGRPWVVDGLGGTRLIDWMASADEAERIFNTADTDLLGRPVFLDFDETDFLVYPIPDALNPSGDIYSDGNYRIVVPYVKRLAALTAGAPTNWFSANAEDALVFMAAEDALDFDRDEPRARLWQSRAQREIKRLIARQKQSIVGKDLHLAPVLDVNGYFTGRRLR